MYVEKKFFKWNNEYYIGNIRLGDSIKEHIDSGSITSHVDDGEIKHTLANNENIWIGENGGFVSHIFYTRHEGDEIIGVDAFDLPYPATEHVCEHLSKRFEPISDIKSIAEMRKTHKGDFLYVIFRDFIPMNLFIIRID